MLTKEIGRSSRIDDVIFYEKRQRDDNDLQDERQDQPKEEEVEPRRCKNKAKNPEKVSWTRFSSRFMVGKVNTTLIEKRLLSPVVQLTVSAVVHWETDGESVLREACQTRASAL
ncbi:hypothetical protein Tco_0117247 [Tanacetum coccineum]